MSSLKNHCALPKAHYGVRSPSRCYYWTNDPPPLEKFYKSYRGIIRRCNMTKRKKDKNTISVYRVNN